jgi:hypothetical protein
MPILTRAFHFLILSMTIMAIVASEPFAAQPEAVAGAGPADGSPVQGIGSWRERIDLYGFVRSELHAPIRSSDGTDNDFANTDPYLVLTHELKSEFFLSDAVTAFFNPRLRLTVGDVDTDGYIGSHTDRSFDLREGYARFRGEYLDITAGRQIISWGVADGINPTDKLCPKDMTIVSSDRDDRRLGVLALKGDLYLGDHVLTGVWQPVFTDSKFRLSDLPDEAEIFIEDVQLPENKLSNSAVALKWAAIFGRTDVSASFFYGWDTVPDIIFKEAVTDDDGTRVTVTPVFNRIQNYGADFASVLGPVILRGEGAYTHVLERGTRSPGRQKSQAQWIVGPEWEWFENFTINAQYGMTHVLDYEPISDDESEIGDDPRKGVDAFNARLNRQLKENNPMATLRIDYRMLQDTLFLQFRGIYFIDDKEYRLRPRVVYDLNDYLNFTVGASLSYGPEGSRFQRSGESYNEVFAELKYSF